MKIEVTATVGEVRVDQQGKISAQCLDSSKNQQGQWETDNSFWINAAGDAVAFFQSLDCTQQRKPLVKMSGFMHGMGKKMQDGSYGKGRITINRAELYAANGTTAQAPAPAPAPAPAAPVAPAPAPAAPVYQAPVAPAAPAGGFGTYSAPAAPVAPAPAPAPAPAAPMGGFGTYNAPQAPVAPAPVAPAAPMGGFVTPTEAPTAPVNPFPNLIVQ